MADITFPELARGGFQVKLEGEGVAPVSERLIFIMRVERQSLSALRQVEAIAMPVQHRGICFLKGAQAGGCSVIGQVDLAPADFLDRARINPAAERSGHQLAAKADP